MFNGLKTIKKDSSPENKLYWHSRKASPAKQNGTGPSDRYGKIAKRGKDLFIKQSGGRKVVKGGGHYSPEKVLKAAKGSTKVLTKLGKFFGGKTLGVLGMLSSTLSHADQPKGKKSEGEQIKALLTKHKLKGGDN